MKQDVTVSVVVSLERLHQDAGLLLEAHRKAASPDGEAEALTCVSASHHKEKEEALATRQLPCRINGASIATPSPVAAAAFESEGCFRCRWIHFFKW